MLKKLKTAFFYKNIFININEKRKLSLIKYNKSLQKHLNIKLINYILLSGKYIEYITKEEIKIYDAFSDNLIFEGNYFNGKGKEYNYFGQVIFEGEYLNGNRNGQGKEYYIDGSVKLEGEFLKGKKWNIKKCDENGNVLI